MCRMRADSASLPRGGGWTMKVGADRLQSYRDEKRRILLSLFTCWPAYCSHSTLVTVIQLLRNTGAKLFPPRITRPGPSGPPPAPRSTSRSTPTPQ
jgi:hypothetical protein